MDTDAVRERGVEFKVSDRGSGIGYFGAFRSRDLQPFRFRQGDTLNDSLKKHEAYQLSPFKCFSSGTEQSADHSEVSDARNHCESNVYTVLEKSVDILS
jgi:hypothetical protein